MTVLTRAIAPEVETVWATLGDVRHRILMAGDGPPVLLLHGIAGSADEWAQVIAPLAECYRVIAPDAPGHGFSDKPRGYGYGLEAYAASTLAVLEHFGEAAAPVVALSGGGTVALHLALEHADRVPKLVLIDAAGLGREVAWSYRIATLPLMRRAFRRGTTPRSIESFGRALLVNRDRLPVDWVDRRQRIWATDGAVEAFFATVKLGLTIAGQRRTFERRLHELRQPVLLLWGRQDPIIPVSHAVRAARLLPDARLHVFDRCGHMPVWEYPDEVARLVTEFIG